MKQNDQTIDPKNRDLDFKIAQAIGYYVMKIQGTSSYCLMKPHRREAKGLGSIRGHGPNTNTINKRNYAYSEADAWEWLPHFSSSEDHAMILKTHMYLFHNLTSTPGMYMPEAIVRDFLQQLKAL